MTGRGSRRLAWHGWLFALVVLAMHVGGIRDYVLLVEPDAAYVEAQGWGQAGAEYFSDYPFGLRILWTITLLAGTAAPILAMARSRIAGAAALTGGLVQALLMALTLTLLDRWEALGASTAVWDAGIIVLDLGFWTYCRWAVPKSTRTRTAVQP